MSRLMSHRSYTSCDIGAKSQDPEQTHVLGLLKKSYGTIWLLPCKRTRSWCIFLVTLSNFCSITSKQNPLNVLHGSLKQVCSSCFRNRVCTPWNNSKTCGFWEQNTVSSFSFFFLFFWPFLVFFFLLMLHVACRYSPQHNVNLRLLLLITFNLLHCRETHQRFRMTSVSNFSVLILLLTVACLRCQIRKSPTSFPLLSANYYCAFCAQTQPEKGFIFMWSWQFIAFRWVCQQSVWLMESVDSVC